MPHSSLAKALIPVVAAAVAAPVVVAGADEARAGGVRVHVGGSVRAGASVHVGRRHHKRHRHRHHERHHRRHHVRGGVYVGGGVVFAEPPPPRPCCARPVPAYYEPAPPSAPVASVVSEPDPRPWFGIGAFVGGVEVDEETAGGDVGVLARFRLSRALSIEAELSKAETDDGTRVDRRFGAALLLDLLPSSSLSPYLLLGLGASRAEANGGADSAEQGYGEIGAGLTWRLSDHVSLAGDIRAGARASGDEDDRVYSAKESGAWSASTIPDEEQYTRARVSALVYF